MKFTKNLMPFLVVCAFSGCVSTESTSTADEKVTDDLVDAQEAVRDFETDRTLMDRYLSNEINNREE